MKNLILTITLSAICSFPCFSSELASKEKQNTLFFTESMISSHLKGYTEEELEAIQRDLVVVRDVCFNGKKTPEGRKPLYLATAGGPGARKSTILERFIENHPDYSDAVYIDPDQRALKFMVHTYYSMSLSALAIAKATSYGAAQKQAYEKWRGASNYISLALLEEAFAEKKDIAHGSTSTGGHIPSFLPKIKEAGYEISFLLCYAEDSFRQNAIEYRDKVQEFYQSTPEDIVNKGKFFAERMFSYFAYADTIYLFWSDDLETPERLAAVFNENSLEVLDRDAYELFIQKYEKDRLLLASEGKIIPTWDTILSCYLPD